MKTNFQLGEIHAGFLVILYFDFAIILNKLPNNARDVLPQQTNDSFSKPVSQQSLALSQQRQITPDCTGPNQRKVIYL